MIVPLSPLTLTFLIKEPGLAKLLKAITVSLIGYKFTTIDFPASRHNLSREHRNASENWLILILTCWTGQWRSRLWNETSILPSASVQCVQKKTDLFAWCLPNDTVEWIYSLHPIVLCLLYLVWLLQLHSKSSRRSGKQDKPVKSWKTLQSRERIKAFSPFRTVQSLRFSVWFWAH